MKRYKYLWSIGLLLSTTSCQQTNQNQRAADTDSLAVSVETPRDLQIEAEKWLLANYDFSDHTYDNPKYSDRYKTYLREGNDAVMGDDASEENFALFEHKWRGLYQTDNMQYDRGGFDPPYVKIVSHQLTNLIQDTLYYDIKVQALGYDQEKPIEQDQYFEVNIKLVPQGINFQIDEIIYKTD